MIIYKFTLIQMLCNSLQISLVNPGVRFKK